MNSERLRQLQGEMTDVQSNRSVWLSWTDKWTDFMTSAKRLDETMASSAARMSRLPLPQSRSAIDIALSYHGRDGDLVNQLITEVNVKAEAVASLVGAEPTMDLESSRVRRYVGVPCAAPTPGESELTPSVRTELCVSTTGLESRVKDWDRVFREHKQMLDSRANQLSRMTEMDVCFPAFTHPGLKQTVISILC